MKELGSGLGSINLDSDCDDDSDNNGGSDVSIGSLDWVNRLFFFMASNESSFWVGVYF